MAFQIQHWNGMSENTRQTIRDTTPNPSPPTYNDDVELLLSQCNSRFLALATIYLTDVPNMKKTDILEFITLAIDSLCTTLFNEDPDDMPSLSVALAFDSGHIFWMVGGFKSRGITMHQLKNNNYINFDWVKPLMHRLFIQSRAKDLYIQERAELKRESDSRRRLKQLECRYRGGEPASFKSDHYNLFMKAKMAGLIPGDLVQSMLIVYVHHERPLHVVDYYQMQARTFRYPTNYRRYIAGDPCFDYIEVEIPVEHLYLFVFSYNIVMFNFERLKVTSNGIVTEGLLRSTHSNDYID